MTLPVLGLLTPRLQSALKCWAEDKRGIAAVEFALIATPFFFLLFGLLEVCVLFIMSSVLEHGVNEAARSIRTGEMQQNGFGQTAFKTAICSELFDLLSCDEKLQLDVTTFSSFSSSGSSNPLDSDGNLDSDSFGFDPGEANDIVVVRVFYEWDLITPFMTKPLSNMSGDRHLLQATVAFRNEPFGD